MRIRTILISIVMIFIICLITIPCYAKEDKKTALYMWEINNNIDYEAYGKMVDYLNINKIYAYIGTAKLSERIDNNVKKLFNFAKEKNIDIYAVYDENYEDQTENERRIKEFLEEIKNYNQTSTYKIKGVAIDSEFHCLDGYSSLSKQEQVQLFRNYVIAMKNVYTSAKAANIEYVVCIPVWLNKLDEGLLEELIQNGCSYVQLMNYSKNNMTTNISEEVAFAKKYNKKIENIAEFQKPGLHEVTNNETFYNDGLEAGINKFQEINEYYNYDSLTFAFHSYTSVIELFNKLDLISNNEQQENSNNNNNNENSNNNSSNNTNNSTSTDENNVQKQSTENKEDKQEEVKEKESQKQNTNKVEEKNNNLDATIATKKIPQTGENRYIVIGLVVVAAIGIVSFIKAINKK